jgi:hypothetical protein
MFSLVVDPPHVPQESTTVTGNPLSKLPRVSEPRRLIHHYATYIRSSAQSIDMVAGARVDATAMPTAVDRRQPPHQLDASVKLFIVFPKSEDRVIP